jgi:hypothetical protein
MTMLALSLLLSGLVEHVASPHPDGVFDSAVCAYVDGYAEFL